MFAFAIKSAIYLSIMYVPYMLMLRNESFFRFNRILLLSIMLLSLILPFCDFHSLAVEANPIHKGMIEIGMPMVIAEGEAQSHHHVVSNGIDWQLVIAYIYVIGVIVTAMVKLYQLVMLYFTIHKGILWKDNIDGTAIYCHANNIVPFSWFSTIVISEQDYRQNAVEIIGHEMGHIRNHHSWDICLVNIIEVIQWMNPLVWILASSLRNVHEYEADDAVLRSGVNARQYQTLLIRKAVGSSSYTFANSFNHSQLKKRFTMMFRKQSNPWMRTKGLYIIPVAVIALSAFATPELNNRIDAITEKAPSVIAGKGTKKSAPLQEKAKENDAPLVEQEFAKIDNDSVDMPTPHYYGTMEVIGDETLYIVDGKEMTRKEFQTIDRASVEHAVVLVNKESIKKYTENPNVNAVVIIGTLSQGERRGSGNLTWTVDGKTESLDLGTEGVFAVVEHMPEYPGGLEEMMKYMAKNVRYPKIAFETGVSARVYVEFIVEKDGYLSGIKTVRFENTSAPPADTKNVTEEDYVQAFAQARQATTALTTEAERVVASMPKWTPGTQNGEPVRVKYVIPVVFRLK